MIKFMCKKSNGLAIIYIEILYLYMKNLNLKQFENSILSVQKFLKIFLNQFRKSLMSKYSQIYITNELPAKYD